MDRVEVRHCESQDRVEVRHCESQFYGEDRVVEDFQGLSDQVFGNRRLVRVKQRRLLFTQDAQEARRLIKVWYEVHFQRGPGVDGVLDRSFQSHLVRFVQISFPVDDAVSVISEKPVGEFFRLVFVRGDHLQVEKRVDNSPDSVAGGFACFNIWKWQAKALLDQHALDRSVIPPERSQPEVEHVTAHPVEFLEVPAVLVLDLLLPCLVLHPIGERLLQLDDVHQFVGLLVFLEAGFDSRMTAGAKH